MKIHWSKGLTIGVAANHVVSLTLISIFIIYFTPGLSSLNQYNFLRLLSDHSQTHQFNSLALFYSSLKNIPLINIFDTVLRFITPYNLGFFITLIGLYGALILCTKGLIKTSYKQENKIVAPLLAIVLIFGNPFQNFTYGYQFEVGTTAITTFGILANVLVLLIFLAAISKYYKLMASTILLLALLHPINFILLLFILAATFVSQSVIFNELSIGRQFAFLRRKENIYWMLIFSILIVCLIVVLTIFIFTGREAKNDLWFDTLSAINGFGSTGGFFFPWKNPSKLKDLILLFFFGVIYLKCFRSVSRGNGTSYFKALILGGVVALLVCSIADWIFYHFRFEFFFGRDFSRISSLVCCIFGIVLTFEFIRTRSRVSNLEILGFIALILAGTRVEIPIIFCALWLFMQERKYRIFWYWLITFFILGWESYFDTTEQTILAKSFYATLIVIIILETKAFVEENKLIKCAQSFVIGTLVFALAGKIMATGFHRSAQENLQRSALEDLDVYLRSQPDDVIFFTNDNVVEYGVRHRLVIGFYSLGNVIFYGNIGQLDRDFKANICSQFFKKPPFDGKQFSDYLEQYLIEAAQDCSASRIIYVSSNPKSSPTHGRPVVISGRWGVYEY